jgi:DNA replication and repair protein RecF
MRINSIALHDFRNHTDLSLGFPTGVSAIIGRNGRGKTNIVEAVNYCAILSSHRSAQDAPLIRRECEEAAITAQVQKHDRTATMSVTIKSVGANKVSLNGNTLTRPRDILGLVQTVIFSPEDLDLVKGDPSARRKYLDEFSTLLTPRFAGIRLEYDRALKQRNSLLKSCGRRELSSSVRETLMAWDEQLIKHGSELVAQRLGSLRALENHISEHGQTISGDTEPLSAAYHSTWLKPDSVSIEEVAFDLREQLAARQMQELDRGLTLVGPHRDDLELNLSAMSAKSYASHGQCWSIALALRLATFSVLRARDDDPILILDDVFAELDQKRRVRLQEAICDVEQTLITAAVKEDLPGSLEFQEILLDDRDLDA